MAAPQCPTRANPKALFYCAIIYCAIILLLLPASLSARAEQDFSIRTVTDKLEQPWAMAFLPDGELLITERAGRLVRVNTEKGSVREVRGVPPVFEGGQSGLLDITLHPEFADNQLIYISYGHKTSSNKYTTRVSRARLDGRRLREVSTVFEAKPALEKKIHFGCALLFDQQGNLFITMGDRHKRHKAQDLSVHMGKVMRVHDDGSAVADNPFVEQAGALPEIYSYGHRNPQGITKDEKTGRIWAAEHGPRGGDEINLIAPGNNYGWPVITYGEEYRGGKIGEGTEKEGMEQPLHYYVPSIATAGVEFYDGEAFPAWKNSLFVLGLRSQQMSRLQLDGNKVVQEERLLKGEGHRLRDIAEGPTGLIYLLDEHGKLLELMPGAVAR